MEFNTTYSTTPIHLPAAYSLESYSFPRYPPSTDSIPNPSHSAAVLDASTPLDAIADEVTSSLPQSFLDGFLQRKKRFAAKSVEEILGLIYERESLREEITYAINYQQCHLKTQLLETPDWLTGVNPQLDKTRGQLEGQIVGLDQEKRREDIACWRDVVRLKSELREALRDFDQEYHKTNLITPWKSENSAGN